MAYLNKVMLIGNIGKDPVVSAGATGRKRVSFSMATSRRYKDSNGETKEDTQWHNIVGWGKSADIFEQLGIKKGCTLYVEGVLTNRAWTDTNGQKKYATEVNMETFQLLSQRSGEGNQQGAPARNPYSHANSQNMNGGQQSNNPFTNNNQQGGLANDEEDDGLPF